MRDTGPAQCETATSRLSLFPGSPLPIFYALSLALYSVLPFDRFGLRTRFVNTSAPGFPYRIRIFPITCASNKSLQQLSRSKRVPHIPKQKLMQASKQKNICGYMCSTSLGKSMGSAHSASRLSKGYVDNDQTKPTAMDHAVKLTGPATCVDSVPWPWT